MTIKWTTITKAVMVHSANLLGLLFCLLTIFLIATLKKKKKRQQKYYISILPLKYILITY